MAAWALVSALRLRLRFMESAGSAWGARPAARRPAPAADLQPVRCEMQRLLAGTPTRRTARLKVAIDSARDLHALWYLRGALMQVLAAEGGERLAREQMAALDPLFTQGWPDAPVSRPAPLG